jgi:hypothetical protein
VLSPFSWLGGVAPRTLGVFLEGVSGRFAHLGRLVLSLGLLPIDRTFRCPVSSDSQVAMRAVCYL